ncbi:MAG: AMP-binding protein [Opitutales bacterium]
MSGTLILHADHAAHLAATLRAIDAGEPVFLGNPRWTGSLLAEALRQVPVGTRTVGAEATARGLAPCDWPQAWRGRILIPTGGTGGRVKFAIHDRETLRSAALALRDALVSRGHKPKLHGAVLTPPWHVSGLMPAIRARETGGAFRVIDGRFPSDADLPVVELPADGTRLASLVPTQLARLLARADGESWLRQFDVILLGGASVPTSLLAEIRARRLPVALTYGMTETAAAAALAWVCDAAAEGLLAGTALPGTRFTNEQGRISVFSPSLCHGYWPATPMAAPFDTGDLGVVEQGKVRVTGRADRVIITGGEKVDPARVEATLTAPGLAKAAIVLGLPDGQWGQQLVATVVASPSLESQLRAAAERLLEPAARPRRYLFVEELPYDARGKIDAERLGRLWA